MPAFPKMKQKKTYTNVKYLLEPIFIKKVIIDIGTFYKPISKNRSSLDLNQKKFSLKFVAIVNLYYIKSQF